MNELDMTWSKLSVDKHLVLLVTVTSKGCFTDEGSNDEVVCALVAETWDRIMGGVNTV